MSPHDIATISSLPSRFVPRRIVVADDHPLFRTALRTLLEMHFPETRIDEARDIRALSRVLSGASDVALVVLDLRLPDACGLEGLAALRLQFPALPVLVVSAVSDRDTVRRVITLGAAGYVHKSASPDELKGAVQAALDGDIWDRGEATGDSSDHSVLTPAQIRMLIALQQGASNKRIAFELAISESTVKSHMSALFRRLGVLNRTQALLRAKELALID